MSRHIVAKIGDIPLNGSKLVEVRGRQIALYYVNGEYFALADRCPHEGGSLCAGRLVGKLTSQQQLTGDGLVNDLSSVPAYPRSFAFSTVFFANTPSAAVDVGQDW